MAFTGGSRKQDLTTHIRLTLLDYGFSKSDVLLITDDKWYKSHTTKDLEEKFKDLKRWIADGYEKIVVAKLIN